MQRAMSRNWCRVLLALLAIGWSSAAWAQKGPLKLDLPGIGEKLGGAKAGPVVTVSAQFTAPQAGQLGAVYVTAKIDPGYHIYSLSQPAGGPLKSVIKLDASEQFRLQGAFQPTHAPKSHIDQIAYPGLKIEEHEGTVTWAAPLVLSAGVDPASLQVTGTFEYQACSEKGCLPPETLPFTATLSTHGAAPPQPLATDLPSAENNQRPQPGNTVGEFRADNGNLVLRGHVEPATAAPGGTVTIVLTAEPKNDWHIYAADERVRNAIGNKPTLIVLDGDGTAQLVEIVASAPPTPSKDDAGLPYYAQPVTWQATVKLPENLQAGKFPLRGIIGFQVCSEVSCDLPAGVRFTADIAIDGGASLSTGQVSLSFAPARYAEAAKLAGARPDEQTSVRVAMANVAPADPSNLLWMIALGFAGGLILNLMPCVLPVIGLKVLSFIEQAGQDRREALMLNVWYSVGIVAVFLALATTAVTLGLAWGEQFGSDAFNITLAAIVFAMALSLLGVWEIPIPGFVGGGTAHSIASKEGPAGAIFKGVLTTILATPCTGPFMGTALAWAVRQPPAYTYFVFGSIGLGMASPYLLIGTFPQLIRFLPKPGAWMGTFKQIMGFVLLGTVIFLLTFIHPALLVQTVTLLTGIGLACWWIARTPLYADMSKQVLAWIQGAVVVGLVAMFAFGWLNNVMQSRFGKYANVATPHEVGVNELAWQPFSPDRLRQLADSGQTVMVDFTADWCLICKSLEQTVLNTKEVKEVVEQNGIVPLVADFTRKPPEIKQMLEKLDSKLVPVLAIFPNGRMDQPIVFRGPYTQATLIDALRQAGPSRASDAPPARTAMTER